MKKIITLAVAWLCLADADLAGEYIKIFNGDMPVGSAAFVYDSGNGRLYRGNSPTGTAVANYAKNNQRVYPGNMPVGTPLYNYAANNRRLYPGASPVGAHAAEFNPGSSPKRILDGKRNVLGCFSFDGKKLYAGSSPTGRALANFAGALPEPVLVFLAYEYYLKKASAQDAAPKPLGADECGITRIIKVTKDGNGDKAGMQVGDTIITFVGCENTLFDFINAPDLEQIRQQVLDKIFGPAKDKETTFVLARRKPGGGDYFIVLSGVLPAGKKSITHATFARPKAEGESLRQCYEEWKKNNP